MLFNIKIKTLSEVNSYSKDSAELFFCLSNSEFNRLIKTRRLKVSDPQKKYFLNENDAEIRIWDINSPNLVIVKKITIGEKTTTDIFRDYLADFIKGLSTSKISSLYVHVPDPKGFKKIFGDTLYYYQSFTEGILLGNYNFENYKSEKKKKTTLQVVLVAQDKKNCLVAQRKAEKIISGVSFARDLVNEPANTLTPAVFAKRVGTQFKKGTVKLTVLTEKELVKKKMNAILSVGKASTNKPRLIIVHYKPKTKTKRKIALVGKGVTYDTGGLSIKPTSGMIEMKADMAGGATVFGIMKTAVSLELPIELIGIVPAVENAISGNAYKPGDIISTSSGKTIEVKDTDAEGRIVLADALEFASKQRPDEIIDFATLTGAAAVALGLFTAAVFSKNKKLNDGLFLSGEETFERVWPMPFWDEYNKLLESKIADISNLGPRWGGAITAGKFLEFFVDKNIPWAHIDLAGPALQHELNSYSKDYCTGFGVRLITRYFENYYS